MDSIVLEIFISSENKELIELYKKHIDNHNRSIFDNQYPNAGFDLFIPDTTTFTNPFVTKMVDLKIKMQMWNINSNEDMGDERASSYYLYPRSSISKTPLMMANQVGIIDSGYRNNLMVALRYFPVLNEERDMTYTLEKNTRLVQICHPSLKPFIVKLLENENELTTTTREGGFGSTGIIGQISTKNA